MSRLIYDDNLVSKFGLTIPNPIIEEVRIYDDKLECDVSIHIRLSQTEEENDIIINNFKSSGLRITIGNCDRFKFEEIKKSNNFFDLKDVMFSNLDIIRFQEVDRDIYDNNGNRYVKFFHSETFGFSPVLSLESFDYMVAFSYGKIISSLVEPVMEPTLTEDKKRLIKNQTSDLSYARVLNNDKTLYNQTVDVFVDKNGNVYDQEVLYSLSDTYHKAISFTKREIFNSVNGIIKKFLTDVKPNTPIETLVNNLLFVLSEKIDSPKFLFYINQANKSSPNKDFALPVGKLYREVNIFVSEANRAIISQEQLTVQRLSGIKLVDLRQKSLQNDFLTEGLKLPSRSTVREDNSYILEPLIVRTTGNGRIGDSTKADLFNINETLFYFDYDKALNYLSEISNFLNPSILMQAFGNQDLKRYFKVSSVVVEKYVSLPEDLELKRLVSKYELLPDLLEFSRDPEIDSSHNGKGSMSIESYTSYKDGIPREIYSYLIERIITTLEEKGDYDVRAYNYVDIQSLETWNSFYYYHLKIVIEDKTMEYYDKYVRQEMMTCYDNLKQYHDYATDFCSYNNIEDSFNDFFVRAVREVFQDPYPWVKAPFYMVLMSEVLKVEPRKTSNRRNSSEGIPLSSELKRREAITACYQLSDSISPEKGSLLTLKKFTNNFGTLVKRFFSQGTGLDKDNLIYDRGSDYQLKFPNKNNRFERIVILPKYISDSEYLVDHIEYSYLQPFDNPKKTGVTTNYLSGYDDFIQFYINFGGIEQLAKLMVDLYSHGLSTNTMIYDKVFINSTTSVGDLLSSLPVPQRNYLTNQNGNDNSWVNLLSLLVSSYINLMNSNKEREKRLMPNLLRFVDSNIIKSLSNIDKDRLISLVQAYFNSNLGILNGPGTYLNFVDSLPTGTNIKNIFLSDQQTTQRLEQLEEQQSIKECRQKKTVKVKNSERLNAIENISNSNEAELIEVEYNVFKKDVITYWDYSKC